MYVFLNSPKFFHDEPLLFLSGIPALAFCEFCKFDS